MMKKRVEPEIGKPLTVLAPVPEGDMPEYQLWIGQVEGAVSRLLLLRRS